VKIWVSQDYESGEYFMYDEPAGPMGPFEISNELFERIEEAAREYGMIQDILDTLVYKWKHPESPEIDCG